jgi:hypothetical protein
LTGEIMGVHAQWVFWFVTHDDIPP